MGSEPKMPELPDVLKGWLSTAQKEMVYAYAQAYAAGIRAEVRELVEATKALSFAAQTTGGVAGRDASLQAAIERVSAALATLENPK